MIKDNLAKKLTFGLKRSDLSKKSGVSEELLYRILTGKTENPGVYTVSKIADALSVSVDELIGRKEFFDQYIATHQDDLEVQQKLFLEVCAFIKEHIQNNNIKTLKIQEIIYVLRGMCDYSIKHNGCKLSKDFASWLCKNNIT
jgi:transcriptional regulator with XRE-family HTH domain